MDHQKKLESVGAMTDKYKYARIAYAAYAEVAENKNYQGLPMPEFDALPERIMGAWSCACYATIRAVLLHRLTEKGEKFEA